MTTTSKRILLATASDCFDEIRRALEPDYQIKCISSVREAEQLLESTGYQSWDLIIASVHVDDSRMFELLQFVRTTENLDKLPFLVIQVKDSQMNVMEGVRATAGRMGACGFVELQDLNEADTVRVLRGAVRDALLSSVREERMDSH